MASLDDLRKRITSVKSTQKITKAMKMVAAAKLRKAQESAEKGRPYSEKMRNIILNLTESINDPSNAPKLLVGTGKDQTYLCVGVPPDICAFHRYTRNSNLPYRTLVCPYPLQVRG